MNKKLMSAIVVSLLICCHTVSADSGLMKINHCGNTSYFDVNASPGTYDSIEFDIYNDSGREMTNYILLYDSMTALNGGNEIMCPEDIKKSETAGWFDDNMIPVTMKDSAVRHMSMGFKVPADASPGVYTAILGVYSNADVMTAKPGAEDGVGLNINQFYTSTVAVVIRVGTPPPGVMLFGNNARIGIGANSGIPYLYIPVVNAGNTYEFPVVRAELYDGTGNLLFAGEKKLDIIYRNTDTMASFNLGKSVSAEGDFKVECLIMPGEPGRFEIQRKVFNISLEKDRVREAAMSGIKAEKTCGPEWSGGYFVLDKSLLLTGVAAVSIILALIGGFAIYRIKKRRRISS